MQDLITRVEQLAGLIGPNVYLQARLIAVDIALLPVGAIEQHGPHLPLDVDAYDAERLCRDVASRCGVPRPLVLPLVPYGVSYHHEDFPGTISLSPETLAQVVFEVGMSVARQGITKLVIVNGSVETELLVIVMLYTTVSPTLAVPPGWEVQVLETAPPNWIRDAITSVGLRPAPMILLSCKVNVAWSYALNSAFGTVEP